MKVVTPEEFLGEKSPAIKWHHGTCSMCGAKLILVCHFGYNTQSERSYTICKNCLADNIDIVLLGRHEYNDDKLDDEVERQSAIAFHPALPHGRCVDCMSEYGWARSHWKAILCRECHMKRWEKWKK